MWTGIHLCVCTLYTLYVCLMSTTGPDVLHSTTVKKWIFDVKDTSHLSIHLCPVSAACLCCAWLSMCQFRAPEINRKINSWPAVSQKIKLYPARDPFHFTWWTLQIERKRNSRDVTEEKRNRIWNRNKNSRWKHEVNVCWWINTWKLENMSHSAHQDAGDVTASLLLSRAFYG